LNYLTNGISSIVASVPIDNLFILHINQQNTAKLTCKEQ
jgi:hypothetical protein